MPRALADLSSRTGLQILYAGTKAFDITSKPVNGTYQPAQALTIMLAGTGITWRYVGANAVTISVPGEDAPSNAGATVDGAIALDTIDVSGGGGATASADLPYQTPGSSAHISMEQMDRVPPVTPGDLFRGTPGVMAATNRAGASKLDINIRGLQSMNRVGITLDGAMQSFSTYRGYSGVDNRVYIDPDLIGGIDITKGPASGGQAVGTIGGVVAMRTLNADDILLPGKDFGFRLRGSTTSGNTPREPGVPFDVLAYILGGREWDHNIPRTDRPGLFDFNNGGGSVALAGRADNAEIVIAGSRRRTGNYFSGTHGPTSFRNGDGDTVTLSRIGKGEEVFNTSQDVTSGLAKIKFFSQEQALEIGYNYYESKYGENSRFALETTLDNLHPYYYEMAPFHKIVRTYTANYGWKPFDNDLIDLRVRAWTTSLDATDTFETQVKMYGGEVSNRSLWATQYGQVKIDYGTVASFESSVSDSGPDLGVNGERTLAAAYGNVAWMPTSWLTLTSGLRVDYYKTQDTTPGESTRTFPDLTGTALSPRMTVMVEPWRGIQFYGQYEEGVRPPSLRENGRNASGITPNPDLVAEKARNFEFGMNILKDSLLLASDKFRFKAAYFENNYDDYLSREQFRLPGVGGNGFRVTNIDRAVFKGVEASAVYDVRTFFAEGAINYYTDIEFCDNDTVCAGETNEADYGTNHIPPRFTGSLTVGTRLFDEKLTLGGRVTYVGERALPLQRNPTYFSVTAEWAPYTLIDAFASYKLSENFRLDFSADNLFDKYYVDALNNLAQPAPGRVLSLTATAKF